jgi:hypothetical protein
MKKKSRYKIYALFLCAILFVAYDAVFNARSCIVYSPKENAMCRRGKVIPDVLRSAEFADRQRRLREELVDFSSSDLEISDLEHLELATRSVIPVAWTGHLSSEGKWSPSVNAVAQTRFGGLIYLSDSSVIVHEPNPNREKIHDINTRYFGAFSSGEQPPTKQ